MRAVVPSIALALLLAACGQGGGNQVTNGGEPESNLSTSTAPTQDLAALLGNQPRLVTLVKAAGMEKALSGKEPYTILAPNDAALDALPAGTLDRQPDGCRQLLVRRLEGVAADRAAQAQQPGRVAAHRSAAGQRRANVACGRRCSSCTDPPIASIEAWTR